MKKLIFIIGLVLLGVILFIFNKNNLVENDYKNTSYLIEGQLVALVDGLAETDIIPGSVSKTITKYFGNEVFGDFNNDGKEDVAFLLTQDQGGSGTFYYLAVALSKNKGLNAIFLGDRISPQVTEFKDGKIIVNYAERKEGDSFADVPSIGVSRYFQVINEELIEIKDLK
ncbi:MAG: hypothetical protein PHG24_01225 [Candidatus Pacebacteria bacterium]|nr:hypothetical protein [Candidatus Paceibacterota bacterium]